METCKADLAAIQFSLSHEFCGNLKKSPLSMSNLNPIHESTELKNTRLNLSPFDSL